MEQGEELSIWSDVDKNLLVQIDPHGVKHSCKSKSILICSQMTIKQQLNPAEDHSVDNFECGILDSAISL
ncbi:Hypothetical predicted protein [Octopus vulgaris]|uniref:Uncharacterized protein n=1 Tax=Octopus vulgaris TaxID=6645 RepID=A0AA36BIR1_OCTVU|nr:Hypothetical predicted protein [Octopus vulgaris]